MQMHWLTQTGADEALVVFGGWAVGPGPFGHLADGRDVLFVDDYRDLRGDLPDLGRYQAVDLLCWSFGVAGYGHWQVGRSDPFRRKLAVAGSLAPVDDRRGLPPAVLQLTRDRLSQASYQAFLTRVFGVRQPNATIDVTARRAELDAVVARGEAPDVGFDRVWICKQDKIFPPANLRRAWSGTPVLGIQAPHAPFEAFDTWDALLA